MCGSVCTIEIRVAAGNKACARCSCRVWRCCQTLARIGSLEEAIRVSSVQSLELQGEFNRVQALYARHAPSLSCCAV